MSKEKKICSYKTEMENMVANKKTSINNIRLRFLTVKIKGKSREKTFFTVRIN